jgi:hypothetical protein
VRVGLDVACGALRRFICCFWACGGARAHERVVGAPGATVRPCRRRRRRRCRRRGRQQRRNLRGRSCRLPRRSARGRSAPLQRRRRPVRCGRRRRLRGRRRASPRGAARAAAAHAHAGADGVRRSGSGGRDMMAHGGATATGRRALTWQPVAASSVRYSCALTQLRGPAVHALCSLSR